LLLKENYK